VTTPSPTKKQLLAGTLTALLIGSLVIAFGILPAEYGIDPTGFGGATGLTKIRDMQPMGAQNAAPGANVSPSDFTPTDTSAKSRFTVVWATRTNAKAPQQGYLEAGEERTTGFILGQANVQTVTARLVWTDANTTAGQQTDPDVFEIQITAPDGRRSDAVLGRNAEPGGDGNATAIVVWRALPSSLEFEAADEPTAQQELAKRAPDDQTASGEWFVRIKLVQAGGTRAQSPAQIPLNVPTPSAPDDAGNSWNLTLSTTTYTPILTQKATEARHDVTTLTVAPGRGIEFKLHADAGQVIDYSWEADQPIYFDLHGEKDGDAPGAFTSHKKGTDSRDAAAFTVPFTGKHGWYFEAPSSSPVTVMVKTNGYYVVLGKR